MLVTASPRSSAAVGRPPRGRVARGAAPVRVARTCPDWPTGAARR